MKYSMFISFHFLHSKFIKKNSVLKIQAGLTSLDPKFVEWQWEEELHVFTLEDVGLGS